MGTILDNRTYFRLKPTSYLGIPCPAEFLAKRPIVKIPADEENEAEYYTVEDGLSIAEALELAGVSVAFMDESGDAPQRVEAVEDADRVLFGLFNVYGSESRAFDGAIRAEGAEPDEVVIPAGNLSAYLKNKTLPID